MSELEYGEDPDLQPAEKQVSLVGCKDEDFLRVHSDVASINKRLMAHAAFELEHTREMNGEVVSVTGRIPVSYVSIGTGGRDNNHWGQLVSGGVFQSDGGSQ